MEEAIAACLNAVQSSQSFPEPYNPDLKWALEVGAGNRVAGLE